MLDFNISLEFKPDVKFASKENVDALVITSCAVHMLPNDDRMYSDFEEQSYNELNCATEIGDLLILKLDLPDIVGNHIPKFIRNALCYILTSIN